MMDDGDCERWWGRGDCEKGGKLGTEPALRSAAKKLDMKSNRKFVGKRL
jgi:hypothetical protein